MLKEGGSTSAAIFSSLWQTEFLRVVAFVGLLLVTTAANHIENRRNHLLHFIVKGGHVAIGIVVRWKFLTVSMFVCAISSFICRRERGLQRTQVNHEATACS